MTSAAPPVVPIIAGNDPSGCAGHVLTKSADEDTPEVRNILYTRGCPPREFTWPRLAGVYHGSGHTPASAIVALLAAGKTVPGAAAQAQNYTWKALQRGWQLGRGQKIPDHRRAA